MDTKDLVGEFMMCVYDNAWIPDSRESKKGFVLRKFKEFFRENQYPGSCGDDAAIDRLLENSIFICNKNKNKNTYKFDFNALYSYRNKKIAVLDEKQIKQTNNSLNLNFLNDKECKDKPKVLEDFPAEKVIFRFRIRQKADKSFDLSTKGCNCCQLNFDEDDEYLKHIDLHMQESRFDYPNHLLDESLPQQFSITYELCENYYVCLSIDSLNKSNEIVGLAVFRSGSIHNLDAKSVANDDVMSESCKVYINWKIFEVACEHPIVVVFKAKNDPNNIRHLEEHHFLRLNGFPASVHLKSKNGFIENELKITDEIPDYKPGSIAKELHSNNFDANVHLVEPAVRNYLNKLTELNEENVCNVFELLVEMEDYALNEAYDNLSQYDVAIERDSLGKYYVKIAKLLELQFQLQEDILNVGDKIVITPKHNLDYRLNLQGTGVKKFFCSIIKVVRDRVYFEVKSSRILENMLCDVEFEPQRLNFKYQHRALTFLRNDDLLKMRLFPLHEMRNSSMKISLNYFNPQIAENPEHMEAVQNILGNTNKCVPFIIFGPPGTGKTTVVVETILQIYTQSNFNRILIAAGSNAACDEVANRLTKFLKDSDTDCKKLLRIYSASYEKNISNIDEEVLKASNLKYGDHYYPCLEVIYTYPIVIATLSVVGRLVHANIGKSHFTHVFLEECGASTEPESLLALAGILSASTNLILSGDPKQLGPIIQSKKAASYGLDRSLLERLMSRECYLPHPVTKQYNRSIQARLIRNFRSHAAILSLPNQLYYDGLLQTKASMEITNFAVRWPGLRNKSFPILFKSVYGIMRTPENSTSWYNTEELNTVMTYVKELMYFGMEGRKLRQEDIGIISPYKTQYQFLRKRLDERGWLRIASGSAETFQGQEKPIIIVSMVRSRVKTPGFLDNPKRLNVLLTRAQSLLVIVGNPKTLYTIGDWKSVLDYCRDNRAIIGMKEELFDNSENKELAIIKPMQDMSIENGERIENSNNAARKPCMKIKPTLRIENHLPSSVQASAIRPNSMHNIESCYEAKENTVGNRSHESVSQVVTKRGIFQGSGQQLLTKISPAAMHPQHKVYSLEQNKLNVNARYPIDELKRLRLLSNLQASSLQSTPTASAPPLPNEPNHMMYQTTYVRQPAYNPAFSPQNDNRKNCDAVKTKTKTSLLEKCVIS